MSKTKTISKYGATTHSIMTFNITTLSRTIRKCDTQDNDAQCLFCLSFMLSFTRKSIMLSVDILNVSMLYVLAPKIYVIIVLPINIDSDHCVN